jgi:phosphoribosylformylglycinamidine synthase
MTNTVVPPGRADAAVLRIKGTERGIATAIDCNSRFCYLDPYLGAMHAVAEACRNVSCTGATPLAITNCLNFGNPEKPAGYFQLDRAVQGIADGCSALGVPVVSGNVSLYNETAASPIFPTPTIGVVGLLEDVTRHATMVWQNGQLVYLVGAFRPHLGGSEYLDLQHGQTAGSPPTLDAGQEQAVQYFVRQVIVSGLIKTAHDVSLGGLAVALAEMATVSECGATIDFAGIPIESDRVDIRWFGEAASTIIIACDPGSESDIQTRAQNSGISAFRIGTTGGTVLSIDGCNPIPLASIVHAYEQGFQVSGS